MGSMNCVKLFNDLTHIGDEVNEKVLEKLLNKFEQYLFLKNIVEDNMIISTTLERNRLIYCIEVDNKEVEKKLLKSNGKKLKYKKRKYTMNIIKKKNKVLELYFSM